jgi:hypothetical protein
MPPVVADRDGLISYKEFSAAMAEGGPTLPQLSENWVGMDMRHSFAEGRALQERSMSTLRREHEMLREASAPTCTSLEMCSGKST